MDTKTFKDLYIFLQSYNDLIIDWLLVPWIGKDKQESLLRLFANLGLIQKLSKFEMCSGNFNNKTISKITNNKSIFYDEFNNLLNLKDKGDSSDLTGINKLNDKHILATTSKNLNNETVGKLDIDKILTNFKQYEQQGYSMSLCIAIRDINKYNEMKNNIESSNHELLDILEKDDTIVIDWNDLKEAFYQFKIIYSNVVFDNLINNNKKPLIFKLHQLLGIHKTIQLKQNNIHNQILWGHIQRSGKSYIIAGSIIEDSKNKEDCNYLILTTAPNETIEQYLNVLDCSQLSDFNIVYLNGNNKTPELKKKNIIICSKQYLQSKIDNDNDNDKTKTKTKTKNIKWLKDMIFEMRFLDESHNGGTTELAQNTLKYYGNNSFTIQITATYTKPINDYNIPKDALILWDLEDVNLCLNIHDENNLQRLKLKHGIIFNELLEQFSCENIVKEYSKYPKIFTLTHEIKEEYIDQIIEDTTDNNYGWSTKAVFLLKQNNNKIISEFQNEKENLKLWYSIFGKYDKFGIPDKYYPDDIVFMKRIKKICKNPDYNSRFIDDIDIDPMVIMCFLPGENINKISKATKKLLEKNKVINDYLIVCINSEICNNPKKIIEDSKTQAKNMNKKGVLVLSGRQCSLGVTIHDCDIVILLNNTKEFDRIFQMMFRCMTEGINKKCGFVIDPNINRSLKTIIDYSLQVRPDLSLRDALKYILTEKIINMNGDHWIPSFGKDINEIIKFTNKIYDLYISNAEQTLEHQLSRLHMKDIIFSNGDQVLLNQLIKVKLSKAQLQKYNEIMDENKKQIKEGIEVSKITKEQLEEILKLKKDEDDKIDDTNVNFMDIIRHMTPLICIFTIHDKETSFIEMCNIIEQDPYLYNILINQTQTWWGKDFCKESLQILIKLYESKIKDDFSITETIRIVKEVFVKNIDKQYKLSKTIDKYLIPQELEKKQNAEISTPYQLRQDMVNKIPIDFWKSPKKVFEPCSGKGGFLIDTIDKFMKYLQFDGGNNEKYKFIVENCLYFSDINPTNIFINKLLLDPFNEYQLNYNEGDTLKLNIKEKWNIDGFDAVIGNPPYNASGNTGTGNTIWQHFTKKSLNEWLLKDGYLLFVHPPGWRKPNTEKSKFIDLYELLAVKNTMIYLEIHNANDGMKTFKCGTRYDWYLVIKRKNNKIVTEIIDEFNDKYLYDLSFYKWIPNSNIKMIFNMMSNISNTNETCEVIHDETSYIPRKKWVSDTKTDVFKYPLIHSTSKNGVKYLYSSRNDLGHFNIPKVIFGDSGINDVIIDLPGKYGLTQHAIGLKINDKYEATQYKKALLSNKFKIFIENSSFSNYQIEWRLFLTLKRDFWRDFIDERYCDVIYSRSLYGSDKNNTSHLKTDTFKYPLIHSTNKNGIRYMYSNDNTLGHFNIPKVIFGQSGLNDVIIDLDGIYGMTECAIGIKVNDKYEALNIKKALLSSKFLEFIKSSSFSIFRIDWRLFTYLKKDFWKEFINDSSNKFINDIDNLLDKMKNTQNEINKIISKIGKTKKIIEL
jgi:hypothetical protein